MVWRITLVAVCAALAICFLLVVVRGGMERRRGQRLTIWQAITRRPSTDDHDPSSVDGSSSPGHDDVVTRR